MWFAVTHEGCVTLTHLITDLHVVGSQPVLGGLTEAGGALRPTARRAAQRRASRRMGQQGARVQVATKARPNTCYFKLKCSQPRGSSLHYTDP